ncbi:MAG TPA: alpha-2-macroglobulin family protein, partial [Polyangia bacterium]|nr:alpha-2-macroglobulin family protein [Polyangia bacterium]
EEKNRVDYLAGKAADKKSGGRGPDAAAAVPLRANFSETAFWQPQLLTGADGSASIAFTVPDSVTSWSLWVHAVSKTLLSGSVNKQAQSIKELMVRPSVPRFMREGDRADLKVVVNNASDRELSGELRFALADPDTGRDMAADFGLKPADLVRRFKVGKGAGTNVAFSLVAPRQVGMASLKVTGVAGGLSDGELRPLPVLPSRMHLVQSKFVTLKGKDRREITFQDMRGADASRVNDQMVITVDAQLFYTVLQALPYLVRYPYECTEQTLNRFLSAGIVSSVFRDHPAVAKMAKTFSARETPLETFDAADPNRKMALEESPWLDEARGAPLAKGSKEQLVNVLDPRIAAAERGAALTKLQKAQTSLGGFPWFPGGPPDPYMTLYIMSGFARAAEFKVPIPKEVVNRGWVYLAQHFRSDYLRHMRKDDCCWEWLTFLNYVAGSYPDASWVGGALTAEEQKEILAFSFRHWKEHSPYLKGLLAMTLHRAGRTKDAKLVWASVMDSAKTRQDEGTFWAPEDRSWLWYNDTIETHASALRVLTELDPLSDKKNGLVLWLLLNKKLNQWKSTRATAEVIYSLVHYLKKEGALGIRENARITVAGKTTEMVFEPDTYTGKKNQIVIPGSAVGKETATVTVAKDTKGFAFASATWHFSTEQLPAEGRGDFFSVSRRYFKRDTGGREATLTPIKEGTPLAVGDEVEVQISLRTKHAAEYVHLRDPRAAGFESQGAVSGHRYNLGISWYEETRDSGANFFFQRLPVGEYTFKYRVRANMAGAFRVGPATVQSMYAPEFNAYSSGAMLKVMR